MSKKYDSIDLAKFVFAILIVALHASALYDISPLLNDLVCEGIGRLGVPFFFVTTSFFLFSKELDRATLKKYCKRLLTLYAAWFIISLPKTIFDRFICSKHSAIETVFRFVRAFFVSSTFSGSWFIVSCVFCVFLFYKLEQLENKKRRSLTIGLSIVVYFWITLTSAYGQVLQMLDMNGFYEKYVLLLSNPYCSFIVGVPYFAVGRCFAKGCSAFLSPRKTIICAVISIALLLSEVFLTRHYNLAKSADCCIMLLPCMVFLFPLIKDWQIQIKKAKQLRIASTIIFFSQFYLLFLCEILEWMFKMTIPCLGKFVITVIGGLALTNTVLRLQDKRWFCWLKYFY